MMEKNKFNYLLNLLIITLLAVVGWFSRDELHSTRKSVEDLRAAVMPRSEIEVRLSALAAEQSKFAAEQSRIQLDIISLRIDVEKMRK